MAAAKTIEDFIEAEMPVYGSGEPASGTFRRVAETTDGHLGESNGVLPEDHALADAIRQIYLELE